MKDDERKEASFRLMQALSGVDEELLEKSEKQENRSRSVRRMAGRWGYAFAACLTLAVAGTSVYCVNRFGNEKIGSMESAVNFAMDAKSGDGVEPEEAAEARQDIAMDGITNAAASTADTAGEQGGEATTGGKDTAQGNTETGEGIDAGAALYAQEAQLTQAQQLTGEQATELEGLGSHVPTYLPADYSLKEAVYGKGTEGQDVLLLYFTDGQRGLLLRLEETEEGTDTLSAADYPVYSQTQDWQALLPQSDQDGQLRFGLLLEDGTLIGYQGALSAEELCRLLDSSIR